MLSKVSAQNFQSWKSLFFDITKGIKLVDGWNEDDQTSEGSGKSAILNAISWGIYGKIPKDAKVDDVIKDGESSCRVDLHFSNGDSIVRSRKPNDLYILKASGKIEKGKDAKETQELIEEYVGMNFETFCQSKYFAQNYDKKFLPSNSEEKGKILANIQNTSVFDKARKEAMDLIKKETEKITSLRNQVQIEDNNLRNFESQKTLIHAFIQDKQRSHKTVVDALVSKRDGYLGIIQNGKAKVAELDQKVQLIDLSQIEADEAQLNAVRPEYGNQLAEVSYKKSTLDSIKKAITQKESEGQSLALKYSHLNTKLDTLTKLTTSSPEIDRLNAAKARLLDLSSNQTRIRLLNKAKQLEDFIANPTKNCPACGSELKTVDTSHTQKELESVLKEVSDLQVSIDQEVVRINQDLVLAAERVTVDIANTQKELSEVMAQLQTVGEYLDQNKAPDLNDLLQQEAQIKSTLAQIDQALRDLQVKKMTKAQAENELKLAAQSLALNQGQYEQIEQELSKLKEPDLTSEYQKLSVLDQQFNETLERKGQIESLLNTSTEYLGRLESLKEGFKETKSHVFNSALKQLSLRANNYLTELFNMEASIKFTNEDQKIETTIILDGQERGLGLLSGGQNRRFNLAVDLALSDLVSGRKSSKLDLLILDEYFKDLSEVSMEKCLDLLKTRKCPVILIEHNSIFKNIVDNTFNVRLTNGTSYAVESL